jgi:hypothetical protein
VSDLREYAGSPEGDEAPEQRTDIQDIERRIDAGLLCEQVLGKELTARLLRGLEERRQAALEELAELNPYVPADQAKHMELRIKIAGIDCWQTLVAEWVTEGQQAQKQLHEAYNQG